MPSDDLGERTVLGRTGARTPGAALGAAVAAGRGSPDARAEPRLAEAGPGRRRTPPR
ncbi:hypothetical protein [Streptomyces poriticola]|uniref:hypothetical protein n=1 Tax=Streptomyces poriticola TaxID=3120506 RepID=UPI002FCE3BA9